MSCKEMIEAMGQKGYWSSPGGKTPSATLYSGITKEIATKGEESRFQKTDRVLRPKLTPFPQEAAALWDNVIPAAAFFLPKELSHTDVTRSFLLMATRSSWKGYLQLSLVCVPVKAYSTSTSGGGEIHLHQLHADCHSRIQYKKVCPLHGDVTTDQIVSGYEYARARYVVVDPDELDRLRNEADKAIKIDGFIASGAFDPLYTSGKKVLPGSRRGGWAESLRAPLLGHGGRRLLWHCPGRLART